MWVVPSGFRLRGKLRGQTKWGRDEVGKKGIFEAGKGKGTIRKTYILTMHMTGIKLKKGTQLHGDIYDEQRRFNICGLVHYLYRIMK